MSTRIDMHTHTKGSDGFGTPEQIVVAAHKARLHGICLTDHHKTYTTESDKVAKALEAAGFLVIRGCEYSTDSGHLLIYGVDVADLKLGFYPVIQDVIDTVNSMGGVCIPSHPYKGYKRALMHNVLALRGVRAYEVVNGQCAYQAPEANRLAKSAAESRNRQGTGGSDAHDPADIGLAYTVFDADIQNERQFLRALKRGTFRAVLSRSRLDARKEAYAQRLKALAAKRAAFLPRDIRGNGQFIGPQIDLSALEGWDGDHKC